MTNLIGKHLFRLLLITVMVIQPAAFSYAMASMPADGGHAHHPMAMVADNGQSEHHHTHNEMQPGDHQTKHDSDSASNCCDSAACCPAAMVNQLIVLTSPSTQYPIATSNTLKGIDPSSETKPPRRFPG